MVCRIIKNYDNIIFFFIGEYDFNYVFFWMEVVYKKIINGKDIFVSKDWVCIYLFFLNLE